MANRSYVRNTMSLEKNPIALYALVAIGGTGAPTLNATKSLGIYSMTRTGVGAYSMKLGLNAQSVDTYQRLISAHAVSVDSSAPSWLGMYVTADNSANASAPAVNIQFLDAAGAAVDPASGESLRIKLELSNSTAV
jgi:hypothetical protein